MKKITLKFEKVSYVEVEAESIKEVSRKIDSDPNFITDKMIEDGADFWDLSNIYESDAQIES